MVKQKATHGLECSLRCRPMLYQATQAPGHQGTRIALNSENEYSK
jgi:hypothetical protein